MTEAQMLKANEGLIYKFAARFLRLYPSLADDILQAARLGFLRAVRQHDPAKGAIGTIAGFLVMREITDALDNELLVSIPGHQLTACRAARKKHEAGGKLTPKERRAALLGQPHASLSEQVFDDDATDAAANLPDPAPGPEALAIQADAAARLHAAVANLAPARAEVVRLHIWGDKTFAEIGEIRRSGGRAGCAALYEKSLRQLRSALSACV